MVAVRKQVTMIASEGENIQTSDRDRVAYDGLSSSSSSTYGQFNRVQA
jgi:hypothetical protein